MLGYCGGYGGYSFDLFGLFLWIMVWVLIIGLVVRLVREHHWFHWFGAHHLTLKNSAALEILDSRYAKGEISKNEYEEKKADIMKQ
ncbi:MAG: SHOCT domain-containing protein [Candidatus Pacebacteria bacterium]|nr:SHOCT domain-containing protein [Candidatus Paceibacterota bacterium]MDD5356901.1 SHOCT domain-containing protein [Candidatus Paceibacterota bacterium]